MTICISRHIVASNPPNSSLAIVNVTGYTRSTVFQLIPNIFDAVCRLDSHVVCTGYNRFIKHLVLLTKHTQVCFLSSPRVACFCVERLVNK